MAGQPLAKLAQHENRDDQQHRCAYRCHQQTGAGETKQDQPGKQPQVDAVDETAAPVDYQRRRQRAEHVDAAPAAGVEIEISLNLGTENADEISLAGAR
jgi:hypothetical protein